MKKTTFIGLAATAALAAIALAPQVSTAQNSVVATASAALSAAKGGDGYHACYMKRRIVYGTFGPEAKFERICTR